MNTNPKALFASIYYGQKIFRYGEHDEQAYEIIGLQIDGIADSAIGYPDCFLELRSVSDLTDEECMKIQVFRGWNSMLNDMGNANATRRWLADIDGNFHERTFTTSLIISDYLRSIGILIPFTYLTETGPITLSTEDIIKRGWAQISK